MLENNQLSYFLDLTKEKIFGKIFLREATWIRPSPPGTAGLFAGSSPDGYFQIDTPKRQYLLHAESKEEV